MFLKDKVQSSAFMTATSQFRLTQPFFNVSITPHIVEGQVFLNLKEATYSKFYSESRAFFLINMRKHEKVIKLENGSRQKVTVCLQFPELIRAHQERS